MLKQANLSFSVTAQANGNDTNTIQFSTQDKKTAKLIFTIKEGKEPLNLTDIDGEITLVMQDKSRFVDKTKVTKPLDGIIEYTLTQEQIRHAGRAQGEVVLKARDGSSVGGFRFNFTIKKALMDEDLGPVKDFYIQDLEAVKQDVKKKAEVTASELNNLTTELATIAGNLEEEYQNKAYTVDEKLADVQATVTDLRKNGTGIDAQARQEVEQVSAQLADTAKKTQTHFVNVAEFGAIGDYYLPNGSVNPSPTDNTVFIQNAFNTSSKVKFASGSYYCKGSILLPKGASIEGNGCEIVFETDGLNLGDHIWNMTEIQNLTILNKGQKKIGKGMFSNNGYIVYPKFYNIAIYGFEQGLYLNAHHDNSNFSWGDVDGLRIESCVYGVVIKGGWANTIKLRNLWLNYIDKSAFTLENCTQFHNFIIDKLTMEYCSMDETSRSSPFHLKNSWNGEITIYDSYIERNGYLKEATSEEVTNFKTNGSPVDGWFYESKSWELNGKVYSEDTNKITQKDLQGSATFRFENCRDDVIVNLKNTFLSTDLLGVASFSNNNENPTNPVLDIDALHLTTHGYSFPNMRYLFTNSNPDSAPVTVKTNKLTNVGGGRNFKYGDVTIIGELFGGLKTGRNIEKDYEEYAKFIMANNVLIEGNRTKSITFNGVADGTLGVTVDATDKSKIIIPSNGVYMFSASFVFGDNNSDGMDVYFHKDFSNQIGTLISNIKSGVLNSLTGLIYLNKGDAIQFNFQSFSDSDVTLVGANNNTNYLLVKKIN